MFLGNQDKLIDLCNNKFKYPSFKLVYKHYSSYPCLLNQKQKSEVFLSLTHR